MIQRSLPAPSCPDAWRICWPVEGLGRCLSRLMILSGTLFVTALELTPYNPEAQDVAVSGEE